MLYPIRNEYRQYLDLSGFWNFQIDPENRGRSEMWHSGLDHPRPIAVPASWNGQFDDYRDFLGPAWYQTNFDLPWGWENKQVFIRCNSINYLADIWLNGQKLGNHEGGHLPFIFDLSEHIKSRNNNLIIRVDGQLASDRVPPGNITGSELDFFPSHSENFPQTQFDFFPYCGIHRPVILYIKPKEAFEDITVITGLEGDKGLVRVAVDPDHSQFRATLEGPEQTYTTRGEGEVRFTIPQPHLWGPESPYLYNLLVEMLSGEKVIDAYSLPVGIRTISVQGNQLLLNDKPIYLKGFGRHEDFPVSGRGFNPPVAIKDFSLMKWIGANSFRTSHYPYAEQVMSLADQRGFLVIDETPAVGLFFNTDGLDRRLALCKQYLRELILRDKNHPSVIAWSLANEPHSTRPEAKSFFQELYNLGVSLDATRPFTLVSCMGVAEESFKFLDFMCLNRYFGWYQESGQIERGSQFLSAELDLLYEKFQKPLILTEFGADAVPGQHALPPEMFSEEFQTVFIEAYIQVLRSKPYVIGEHIWNFADFKTSQGITRMGGYNFKGIFTRNRRPKLAAHRLRDIWTKESEEI